ncbi:MAG: bifunctional 4-hydroxy-2-oxoglutarate aldolase/2-dehydro-3-deoxy-phosphogluconate aldolase [Desulfobacteraceae bacterium]
MELTTPVIGILRGIPADFFGPLLDAAFQGGLQAIEVTLNTPQAEEMIAAQRPRVPQGKLLGMGTVCNLEMAKRAVDAGAMFLVTPNTDEKVIDFAVGRDIPVVAGAFTPTEVYSASGIWWVPLTGYRWWPSEGSPGKTWGLTFRPAPVPSEWESPFSAARRLHRSVPRILYSTSTAF